MVSKLKPDVEEVSTPARSELQQIRRRRQSWKQRGSNSHGLLSTVEVGKRVFYKVSKKLELASPPSLSIGIYDLSFVFRSVSFHPHTASPGLIASQSLHQHISSTAQIGDCFILFFQGISACCDCFISWSDIAEPPDSAPLPIIENRNSLIRLA